MKINWFKIHHNSVINNITNTAINSSFSNLIRYLKMGLRCNDCGNIYIKCSCDDFYFSNIDSINKFHKYLLELIKFNLSLSDINTIKFKLNIYVISISHKSIEDLKIIKNFINKLEEITK